MHAFVRVQLIYSGTPYKGHPLARHPSIKDNTSLSPKCSFSRGVEGEGIGLAHFTVVLEHLLQCIHDFGESPVPDNVDHLGVEGIAVIQDIHHIVGVAHITL